MEQVFRVSATIGKRPNPISLDVKVVNQRIDPDDPEQMDLMHKLINKLTPQNVQIHRDGMRVIHDNPDMVGYDSVHALADRPPEMQTKTLETNPPGDPERIKQQLSRDIQAKATNSKAVDANAPEAQAFEEEERRRGGRRTRSDRGGQGGSEATDLSTG